MAHAKRGGAVREEIDFAGFHYRAQIGMRRSGRRGSRLVIHQRDQRRVLAVRKSRPAFDPILDPRGQFYDAAAGKNHKIRIRGRPRGQLNGLRVAQHGKAPHEVAKFKVSVKPASQFLVKIPDALSGGYILVDQYRVERWTAPGAESAACLVNNCGIHGNRS